VNAPLLSRPVALRMANLGDEIERARIGAFVHDHPEGTPFHLPAWSVGVARGCGQKSHYLVAENAGGDIAGVMPLTEISSPIFGKVLASAGFGVAGGILTHDPRIVSQMADAAWTLAQELKCPVMEVRGGPLPGPEWSVDDSRYLGFVRALAEDDDAQLLAIPRKQRAEVRKALEKDLEISIGCNAEDVAAHYAVYAESVRNLGTPVFPRSLFSEVLREFGNSADVLIVRHGGVAVSSVLSLYWKGTVYPYWGGGTPAARGLRANDRMYFELMRHARTRGCTPLRFRRSKVGTGPGGVQEELGLRAEAAHLLRPHRRGRQAARCQPGEPEIFAPGARLSKLPLWIANRAGPLIAKGLG
jgi:FemAB-related protein (PEP-CTERM system-associated)